MRAQQKPYNYFQKSLDKALPGEQEEEEEEQEQEQDEEEEEEYGIENDNDDDLREIRDIESEARRQ